MFGISSRYCCAKKVKKMLSFTFPPLTGKEMIETYFDFRLFRLWKTRQHSKLLDYDDLLWCVWLSLWRWREPSSTRQLLVECFFFIPRALLVAVVTFPYHGRGRHWSPWRRHGRPANLLQLPSCPLRTRRRERKRRRNGGAIERGTLNRCCPPPLNFKSIFTLTTWKPTYSSSWVRKRGKRKFAEENVNWALAYLSPFRSIWGYRQDGEKIGNKSWENIALYSVLTGNELKNRKRSLLLSQLVPREGKGHSEVCTANVCVPLKWRLTVAEEAFCSQSLFHKIKIYLFTCFSAGRKANISSFTHISHRDVLDYIDTYIYI